MDGRASSDLKTWIAGQIAERGPVTFAQFMDWALYHPTLGYYSRGPNISTTGDFTTSPEASSAFGALLAAHVAEIDEILGSPPQFTLVEFGPGRGTLASQLLNTLCEAYVDLYKRLRYVLVEISPGLTLLQKDRLRPEHEARCHWTTALDKVGDGFVGAVLANEVVDAFPVHSISNRDGNLLETFVDVEGFDLAYTYLPPSDARLRSFVEHYSLDLLPGEQIEICTAQSAWLAQISRAMKKGIVSIIDYGDTQPGRYSAARRQGTMLAYHSGAVSDNLLAQPGAQDLTALVDFTALRDQALAVGFQEVGVTRQANFLLGLGLGTLVTPTTHTSNLTEALNIRKGMQALISPDGLGRFHVLILSRNLDPAAVGTALSGLKYKEL